MLLGFGALSTRPWYRRRWSLLSSVVGDIFIAVEGHRGVIAVLGEEVVDGLLLLGCEGFLAVLVEVILAVSVEQADELAAHGGIIDMSHGRVDALETVGHTYGATWAVVRAVFSVGTGGIDGRSGGGAVGELCHELVAQTLAALRAAGAETNRVVLWYHDC